MPEGLLTFLKLTEQNYSYDTLRSHSIQESQSYILTTTLTNNFRSILPEHVNWIFYFYPQT